MPIKAFAGALLAVLWLSGCGSPAGEHSEAPGLVYTHYTADSELFVEFPPLVVGQSSRFLAHFTRLADHSPVRAGQVERQAGAVRTCPLCRVRRPLA